MSELERELRLLAGEIAYPATPDLAQAIPGRLSARKPSPWPRRLALAATVLVVAVLAGLAVPQTRAEILRFFGLGAVKVELVDRLPAIDPGAPLAVGDPVARKDAPFPILQPSLLGEPDRIYAYGNVVTLVYGSPRAIRLLVTEISGHPLSDEVAKKLVSATTSARLVPVRGAASGSGLWIEGEPHLLELRGAPPRLAANTLVWRKDDLTFRIEGSSTREEAVRIAESFR